MKDVICPKCGPTTNAILAFVEQEDGTVLAQCLNCGFKEVRSSEKMEAYK